MLPSLVLARVRHRTGESDSLHPSTLWNHVSKPWGAQVARDCGGAWEVTACWPRALHGTGARGTCGEEPGRCPQPTPGVSVFTPRGGCWPWALAAVNGRARLGGVRRGQCCYLWELSFRVLGKEYLDIFSQNHQCHILWLFILLVLFIYLFIHLYFACSRKVFEAAMLDFGVLFWHLKNIAKNALVKQVILKREDNS